jgi:hypothetical protein
MVIMVPTNTPELVAEAAELGVACIDTDGIKAFNRSRKTMKKWGTRLAPTLPSCSLTASPLPLPLRQCGATRVCSHTPR